MNHLSINKPQPELDQLSLLTGQIRVACPRPLSFEYPELDQLRILTKEGWLTLQFQHWGIVIKERAGASRPS